MNKVQKGQIFTSILMSLALAACLYTSIPNLGKSCPTSLWTYYLLGYLGILVMAVLLELLARLYIRSCFECCCQYCISRAEEDDDDDSSVRICCHGIILNPLMTIGIGYIIYGALILFSLGNVDSDDCDGNETRFYQLFLMSLILIFLSILSYGIVYYLWVRRVYILGDSDDGETIVIHSPGPSLAASNTANSSNVKTHQQLASNESNAGRRPSVDLLKSNMQNAPSSNVSLSIELEIQPNGQGAGQLTGMQFSGHGNQSSGMNGMNFVGPNGGGGAYGLNNGLNGTISTMSPAERERWNQIVGTHTRKKSASISIRGLTNQEQAEIKVTAGGPDLRPEKGNEVELSFPSTHLGYARRLSEGILGVLKITDPDLECCVCCSEFEKGEEMSQLQCGHMFHRECVAEWLLESRECPYCRMDVWNYAKHKDDGPVNENRRDSM